MKKSICCLLAAFFLFFAGCASAKVSENQYYSIIRKDNQYLLRFSRSELSSLEKSWDNQHGSISPVTFSYPSLKAMKESVLNGEFTREQRLWLSIFPRNDRGDVLLCDFDKLYDVTLPDNAVVLEVNWYGQTYTFNISTRYSVSCSLSTSPSTYEYVKNNKETFLKDERNTIISELSISDRNATEYVYTTTPFNTKSKAVMYTYISGSKTISFCEIYAVEGDAEKLEFIDFWGTDNGQPFSGTLFDLSARPPYEWLQAFGLKSYIETETE